MRGGTEECSSCRLRLSASTIVPERLGSGPAPHESLLLGHTVTRISQEFTDDPLLYPETVLPSLGSDVVMTWVGQHVGHHKGPFKCVCCTFTSPHIFRLPNTGWY